MTIQSIEKADTEVCLSVVIPAYNASKYIAECLTSVLAQEDAPPFEVIVVDDGSHDNTAEIVAHDFPSVRLIRKPNGGAGSARNRGVAEARGEVIVFIDADDVMLPGRLAFQGGFMLANPRFGLTFGNQQYQRRPLFDHVFTKGLTTSFEFIELSNVYERLLAEGNFIPNVACAVRYDAYISSGGQPEDSSVCEDYAMNCAIARNWPIAVSRKFFTLYRQGHGDNLMASAHYTHYGPLKALSHELLLASGHISGSCRKRVMQRGYFLANVLLRWLWIEKGRAAVLEQLEEESPLFSRPIRYKWRIISLLPPAIGRLARAIKRTTRMSLRLGFKDK